MPQKRELTDRARAQLGAPDDERIYSIRLDRWIGYGRAKSLLDELGGLVVSPNVNRPEGLFITGETHNGKTFLARRFEALHPAIDDPHASRAIRPVIRLDAPCTPSEERLYNHILEKLSPGPRPRHIDDKRFKVIKVLRDLQTRVLVLDEINNALAGIPRKQEEMLNAVKELSSDWERPIVLTGTFKALTALRANKEIQNRFPPVVLPRWELDEELQMLLASFEKQLPLRKASHLADPELATLILDISDGLIGEMSKLIRRAAVHAIQTGKERITEKLIGELEWIPYRKRDQAASAAEQGLAIRSA